MLQNHCKNEFAAFFYSASRACLKNHSHNLRSLLCGIFSLIQLRQLNQGLILLLFTGKVLYIGTYDHQISQIIFKGEKNTYVYDTTEVRLHMDTYLDFYENIPVPLQGMNADNYEIYVMYQDGFYDTQQTFAIN